ncbi:radical SAM additional 4Fe4S-binding SPASM domain-containing protein [Ruminococcaceae bacterium YRB3002]|nr:radical SAM additional 4Fe4S-binding SPASM domain-containing protein [Ruminococcaceae bacterium YRB3002]
MMQRIKEIKTGHLNELADYVEQLYKKPQLRHLFFELTTACNEHCFHCGSNCDKPQPGELTTEEYKAILDQIKEDFDIDKLLLCITGGEPLLRRDFFEIMNYAKDLGFKWGMTSNATLITKEVAHKLAEAGMKTISVSIDGLPETHDKLRGYKRGFELAMRGVQNLIDEDVFAAVQITTVLNHENMKELPELFEIMKGIDIDSWRVINLEPIGRALTRPELMCTPEDLRNMFDFIRQARRDGYPVLYGCSHYLGLDYEAEVRDWYWLCNAGVYTASIMSNGDIGACLDIERNPKVIQGNIRKDRFKDVWDNRFEIFRRDKAEDCAGCRDCEHRRFCRGGAYHSWDYDKDEPLICMKGVLFDIDE